MKTAHLFFVLAGYLALNAPLLHADQLDDQIADLRNGTVASIDPDKRAEVLKATHGAATKAYLDGIVKLYLWEIKASIVDPEKNGGWPYRSFLIEDNSSVRQNLTKELKKRFDENADSILAYALICPAIYAGDDKLIGDLELYLKDNDSFLYEREQADVDKYWRPYIKDILEKEAVQQKAEK